MSHALPIRRAGLLLVAASTVLASAAVVAVNPAAAASGFAAGDVVVYRVGSGSGALSGNGAAVFLDEYSPSGSLVRSVPLPATASGANKPLVASGSASSEGLLSLSGDGRYLVAPGYAAAVGTAGLSGSAAASVPRTVARVDAAGTVDTTTSLTDFSDGNNPRSVASADGTQFWVGGAAGGARYATLGATTSTALTSSTYKNVRQVQDVGGQLYTSADPTKAGATVATIGTGLPTTANQSVTNLKFGSAPADPLGYSLLTLGSGSAPDTLYVANNSVGTVVKYSLVSGTWVAKGSVAVANAGGLTANDVNGTVTVYVTSSGAASTSGNLYSITDASGAGGTLSGSASLIASAPANEAFRGVAFAPGTVIGSGGAPPSTTPPTVSVDHTGLPAALGDPADASDGITVGDASYPAGQLTVTATSSNQSVAANNAITVSGSGANRTLTVTPAGVGTATLTVTVTAPDSTSTTTQVSYAVSADIGRSDARYYSGAGNASAAVDVSGGYALVGDDENNVLRLYDTTTSGPPVKTFDYTSVFPFGATEIDLETAARHGDVIYWNGSMSNTSSGKLAPSRSTIFATRITGSGASTSLTYLGSYTGLKTDLVAWDQSNGHGLGANYLGLADSSASGVDGHANDALNVEGMEFVGNSSTTAYLSFRAPLEPTTNRHLALLVPVTNVDAITSAGNPGSVHATFGAPVFLDLGGLGVRDIKENADGQYLIIAGSADDSNGSFVLYTWDGNPNDDPQPSATLPQLPSAGNAGSWETIVSVPEPLTAGSTFELIQDDGTVDWYGDGATTKNGLAPDLAKSVGVPFSYSPPAVRATRTTLNAGSATSTAGQQVTYTAGVGPVAGNGSPTGSVEFTDGGVDISGCSSRPVTAGAATCTVSYAATGQHSIIAGYNGDATFAASSSAAVSHAVAPAALDSLVLAPGTSTIVAGDSRDYTAEGFDRYGNDIGDVTASTTFDLAPTSDGATNGAGCTAATCTATAVGRYLVSATNGGATGSATLNVSAAPVSSLTLSPADASADAGDRIDYTASGNDAYGNSTGDETAAATFAITPVTDGSANGAACAAARCTATAVGTYRIDASVVSGPGSATGSTTLTVTPGPLAKLTLSPPAASVLVGSPQDYTAAGADGYGNTLGDVTSGTIFTIDGVGTCSGSSCSSLQPGRYTVTGTDGSVSDTAILTVTAPVPVAPTVTSVDPGVGSTAGGTTVTISGTGFTDATAVSFGGLDARSYSLVSDSRIDAVSPAHSAKTINIFVTTAGGTSATVTADRFTFRAPPPAAPSVSAIAPGRGPSSGGTTVTVDGAHFDATSTVAFGSVRSTDVTVVSSTQLRAVSPPLPAGTYYVRVTAAGGTSAVVSGDGFTSVAAAPALSAISPGTGSTAGGTSVTISGSGFTGATAVRFASVAAGSFTVMSDTEIDAVSPAHSARSVNVAVTTPVGTSQSGTATRYAYVTPPPTISALAPRSGSVAGGASVTITGTAFSGATRVLFGSFAATSFTVVSDTRITATSPAQSAGSYDVTVTTPSGSSGTTSADAFRYVRAAPAVTGVSPDSGPDKGGATVTLTGSNFTGATDVQFGASSATRYTVVSDSRMTAVSPPHSAGVRNVTVTGPGGTSPTSAAAHYTYG